MPTLTILDLKNQFVPGTSQPERKKGHLQCTAQFLNSGNWNTGTQSHVWGLIWSLISLWKVVLKAKIKRGRKVALVSQEHLGAPIYWSPAPIYWSPKILFSTFWKGMKRKSYDKTRFCVSHEGLSNGLGTFGLTWYMFENKTKNMFLIWRGSNVLEPRLQYNGARAPIYWSHQFFFPIRQ